MAAVDAQFLLLSAAMPNDQFLVYVVDGKPAIPKALAQMRRNARGCEELRLRVRDDRPLRHPRWVRGEIAADQFVVHDGVGRWPHCLEALARLDRLDVSRMAWRVHVFPPNVVVVQIAHCLGDGTRAGLLAAALLGRPVSVPAVRPERGAVMRRAAAAARAHRGMVRDIEAGLLDAAPAPRPSLSLNARSGAASVRRTLVVDRASLAGRVTVAALCSISEALAGYLAARGEDISRLGAEIPMAQTPSGFARNNFRNVSVGLHPGADRERRAHLIAAEIAAQRRRGEHPAVLTSARAFAAVPAPVLRWGMARFDPQARSATVAGHTIVSSVNRGPADLAFGGCPVLFTAGFPALSPMMGLTHGVHGIGDRVAISVHADPGVIDVDDYLDRLAHALPLAETSVWPGKCE